MPVCSVRCTKYVNAKMWIAGPLRISAYFLKYVLVKMFRKALGSSSALQFCALERFYLKTFQIIKHKAYGFIEQSLGMMQPWLL